MKTKLFWLALVIGVLAGWVALAEVATGFAPLALAFGWIPFLFRVLPRITVDWGSVAVGGVAVVLFCGGIHWIGRAWRRQREGEAPVGRRWKVRWSLAFTLFALVLFAAGTSLVGIVHQVGWLATGREPVMVPGLKGYSSWDAVNRMSQVNNLKQIAIGMHGYAGRNDGLLPAGGSFAPDGSMRHSWETMLLSDIGWYAKGLDLNQPWDAPGNAPIFRCVLPQFINPSSEVTDLTDAHGFGLSHYAANVNVMGANTTIRYPRDLDTTTTLLIGEVNAGFQPWGHPVNWRDPALGINRSPHGFGGSPSKGGATFLMADGSVQFVSEKVSPEMVRALGKAGRKEPIDLSALPKPW